MFLLPLDILFSTTSVTQSKPKQRKNIPHTCTIVNTVKMNGERLFQTATSTIILKGMKLALIFEVSFGKDMRIPVTSCKTGIVKSTAVKRAYVTAFRLPPRSASYF